MSVRSAAGAFVWTALLCVGLGVSARAQTPSPVQVLDQAQTLHDRNDFAGALKAATGLPDGMPAALQARKHRVMAYALLSMARPAEAVPHIEAARAQAGLSSNRTDLIESEQLEGTYRRMTDTGDRGLAAFHRAAELALATGDRRLLGAAYFDLAAGYQAREEWDRSRHYMEKWFELLDSPTPLQRFNHANGLGIVYFEQSERGAAEAQFNAALKLALESGGKGNESLARGKLADTYWEFDRDEARAVTLYDHAIALAVEAKVPSLELEWRLSRANIWRDTGRYDRALDAYRDARQREEAVASTQERFALTKNIAQVYRLTGRYDEARALLEPLVDERPWDPSPRFLWQAYMELGSTYEALKMPDRADSSYREMLTILEDQRSSAILDTSRTGSFARSLDTYDPYDRYIRFVATSVDRAADALELSERARARGFFEMLKPARSSLVVWLPPGVLDEDVRIVRAISAAQGALRRADLPRADRETRMAELDRLERERDAFRLKLRAEHPAVAEARFPSLAVAAELQQALRPGEVALSYFLSEPESFRWTVSRDGIRFDRLAGRAAVEAQTERLRRLIRAPSDRAETGREAEALARLVLAGLDLPPETPLVIVPHGVLHYVPFEALPLGGGPLIDRHAVTYAASLNSLAHSRQRPRSTAPFRVILVGNPTVAAAAGAADSRRADGDSLALLGPLPFAQEELQAIYMTLPSSVNMFSGSDARESAMRTVDASRASILHISTRGLISESHPGRSGLLLSPEDGQDGVLQVPEIYGLSLENELLVLSAFQTALGREITGEGIVGLTRAFLYAGSHSVVAALWNLNDRFAAEFVGRFYRELREGRTIEEALRQAKRAYLNHPKYGHPFYWSSLVLTGDGTHAFDPGPQTEYLWWFGGVAVFFILLAAASIVLFRVDRRRPA